MTIRPLYILAALLWLGAWWLASVIGVALWRGRYVTIKNLTDLQPDPKNVNRGTPRGHGVIEQSIRRHGAGRSGLAANDGTMIAGSQTLEEMAALGMPIKTVHTTGDEWVVVVRDDVAPGSEQAKLMAIEDNRSSELGLEWEPDVLAELAGDLDLSGLFTQDELAEYMRPVEIGAGGDEFDPTPDDGPTRSQAGDLWIIGGVHRLICDDCTDPAVVARLMGGEQLDLIVTDPPYGVSYADKNRYLNTVAPANRIQVPIEGDHGTIEETAEQLWKPAFETMHGAAMRGCALYCFMPQGGDQMMMMMMMSSKWPPRHELIWLKNNHVLGRADYAYKHEPIMFTWKDEGHRFYGGFQVSVLAFDKPQKSDLHPTTKPIELIMHLVGNSSQAGDLVGDWFLGSGTTLIAAHRTRRRCYGIEISEHYCDVILRRAEAEGLECVLSHGETDQI